MTERPNSAYSAEMSPTEPDVLVKVEGAGKKFCRDLKKSLWYGAQDIIAELTPWTRNTVRQNILRSHEFWAIDDVSFELKRGECLGLIGRNGAGKTTLLKILNGLIKPDKGRIEMGGRIGALIALGAGFNPILTGRENIYVNASVLGLRKKEIDNKLDEIIDFAELEKFIDSPVQTYSSGMQVRLGFAVATTLEPDIILLDEVLAVGDAAFRNKCYQRLGERRKTSGAIFVSHSMDQVGQFCDRVLVLSAGHVVFDGDTTDGIAVYENLLESDNESNAKIFEKIKPPITAIQITLDDAKVLYGEYIQFKIDVNSETPVSKTTLKIVFYDQQHRPCAEWNSERIGHTMSLKSGPNSFKVKLGPMLLKTGKYRLGIVLTDEYGLAMLLWSLKKHEVMVEGFTALGPSVSLRSELIQC